MSIGPGKPFEGVIISLLQQGEMTNPSSELAVFSRVTEIDVLAVCNTNG